jgi:hypothetical protein
MGQALVGMLQQCCSHRNSDCRQGPHQHEVSSCLWGGLQRTLHSQACKSATLAPY